MMLYKLLLILIAYLPFQLALNPAEGIDLASIRVFILILFFLWLTEGLKNKKIIIKNNIQTYLILIFLFLSLFSIFFARNTDWSLRKILYLLSIFPIYFVVSGINLSEDKIKKIFKILTISGTIVAAVGIFQFTLQFMIGLNPALKFWSNCAVLPFLGKNFGQLVLENSSWLVNISGETYFRAVSIFPDPHMFSLFCGLLLPITLGFWINSRNKLWLISALIIFLADILTFSRGAYLGIAGVILFLLFIFWKEIGRKYKLAFLSLGFIFLLTFIIPNPISARFFSSFNLKEGSNAGRMEMWGKSLEIIENHPIIGVGIGNYSLEVNSLADYRNPIYAHNTYLDIAAETGILNGLVWISLIIFSILAFLKKSQEDNFFLWPAVSLVIFSVHSLADTGIYSPVVLTIFLIIMGLNRFEVSPRISRGETSNIL